MNELIHIPKRQAWKEEQDMKVDACQDNIETIQTALMKVFNRFKLIWCMHELIHTYGESIHIESETFVIRFK